MKRLVVIPLLLIILVSGCISATGHVSERSLLEEEMIENLINESIQDGNETDAIGELSQEMESLPFLNRSAETPETAGGQANEPEKPAQESEPKDPCAGISCPKVEKTCPDGYRSVCQTHCNPETGTCAFCTPECSGHERCEESWSCTAWSECAGSRQTRTCTDASSCGTTEGKPAETRSCEEPEEPEHALYITVDTDNSTIVKGRTVTITTRVTDGTNPIAGAEVYVLLTYASGHTAENSSLTDQEGRFVWVKKIGSNSNTGIFTINSTATKEGYISGNGYTTFEVIKAG